MIAAFVEPITIGQRDLQCSHTKLLHKEEMQCKESSMLSDSVQVREIGGDSNKAVPFFSSSRSAERKGN